MKHNMRPWSPTEEADAACAHGMEEPDEYGIRYHSFVAGMNKALEFFNNAETIFGTKISTHFHWGTMGNIHIIEPGSCPVEKIVARMQEGREP